MHYAKDIKNKIKLRTKTNEPVANLGLKLLLFIDT